MANNFQIDTKGTCFMCLEYKGEGEVSCLIPYSIKRLSEYLNLDFQNVYNLSIPNASTLCAGVDVVVSVCGKCFQEATKFVKLHMDMESIRKQLSSCVGKIAKVIKNAEKEPNLVRALLDRISGSGYPLDLIQASIVTNLRNETIKKCESLKSEAKQQAALVQPDAFVWNPPAISPSVDTASVTSTTTIATGSQTNTAPPEVIDLDSDESSNDAEQSLVIKSVCGASQPPPPPTSQMISVSVLTPGLSTSGFLVQPTHILNVCPNKYVGVNMNSEDPSPAQPNSKWTCSYCSYTIPRKRARIKDHMISSHRAVLFATFRDPKTDDESFKNIVEVAIGKCYNYNAAKPVRNYTCRLCSYLDSTNLVKAIKHVVTFHFGNVGENLKELQRGIGNVQNSSSTNVVSTLLSTFSCPRCQTVFFNQLTLLEHMKQCNNQCVSLAIQQPSLTPPTTPSNPPNPTPPPTLPVDPSPQSNSQVNYSYVVKWKCGICGVTYENKDDLKEHKFTAHDAHLNSEATTFNCPHCTRKFKFLNSQRLHTLTAHKFQVFSKYVSDGTMTPAEIDRRLDLVLESCKISNGNIHTCNICNKEFAGAVASILSNHILTTHFQTVVRKLQYPEAEGIHGIPSWTTPSETIDCSPSTDPQQASLQFYNENDDLVLP